MTLMITVAHATPGYPANAFVVDPPTRIGDSCSAEACIHSGKSVVVHELQGEDTPEDAESRALTRMWDAYSVQAGGKTFDGKPLPTWDELGDERQACWRAALRAL